MAAAKTKKETWAENPVEASAFVLPRRISNPLKDINVEIGGRVAAPAKSMVKAASWSDFEVGVYAASTGPAAAVTKKVVVAEAGAAEAASNKATEEVVVVAEAGAARANKKAAAAQAEAEEPYHFPVPSEEYFNLWEDPKDREEIRASFTRIAELFAQ